MRQHPGSVVAVCFIMLLSSDFNRKQVSSLWPTVAFLFGLCSAFKMTNGAAGAAPKKCDRKVLIQPLFQALTRERYSVGNRTVYISCLWNVSASNVGEQSGGKHGKTETSAGATGIYWQHRQTSERICTICTFYLRSPQTWASDESKQHTNSLHL